MPFTASYTGWRTIPLLIFLSYTHAQSVLGLVTHTISAVVLAEMIYCNIFRKGPHRKGLCCLHSRDTSSSKKLLQNDQPAQPPNTVLQSANFQQECASVKPKLGNKDKNFKDLQAQILEQSYSVHIQELEQQILALRSDLDNREKEFQPLDVELKALKLRIKDISQENEKLKKAYALLESNHLPVSSASPVPQSNEVEKERDDCKRSYEELRFQQMAEQLTEVPIAAQRTLGIEDLDFIGPLRTGWHGIVYLWNHLSQRMAVKMLSPYADDHFLSSNFSRLLGHAFGNVYVTLLQNSHLGIANIFTSFRAPTQTNLLSVDSTHQPHCLVDDGAGKPIALQHGLLEETVYIVQELGSSNLAAIERDHVDLPRVWEIAFQLLCTVDFLNKRGVFHMGIKMSRILIMQRHGFEGSFYVLCSFEDGVLVDQSQSTGPAMAECNLNEYLAETVLNRAPEALTPQIVMSDNNSGATSVQRDFYNIAKTDVWAIGCVLWRLLCGAGVNLFQTKEEIRTKPIDLGDQLNLKSCKYSVQEEK
ncbi:hypothetical protein Pelo_16276 [Pelomyxa schiedti]|nr:hypothetical protein Pelo_16276 [Pelomyxa schiedti]